MNDGPLVIFIHGAWVTPLCWRYFAPHFVNRGFTTLSPSWPLKERPVDDQLRHPDPRLAKVGIPEIVGHYKAIIQKQVKPPVLIGHSFGGLIVQLLLDQGFGAAGIAISSIPPRGVSPIHFFSLKPLKKMRSLFGAPFSWRTIVPPPQPNPEEQALRKAQGIQTHLVPESGRIFWQLLSRAARVNFRNHDRPPLLLVACGQDIAFPAATYRRNCEMYGASKARTDFVLFPDLTHFSIAEPGHEALAAYCAEWASARFRERERGRPADTAREPCLTESQKFPA
jgi:pimeloyl-ACP methyl ester carboxylesterase